jgi:hypothetical protein
MRAGSCPNHRNTYGANRETWLPNPAATSSVAMEMYTFLGKAGPRVFVA